MSGTRTATPRIGVTRSFRHHVPASGTIYINAGSITWSLDVNSGFTPLVHGTLTDFPMDQVCDVLSG